MLQNAGAEPPHFPMRVGAFLDQSERYLRRGDIILSRNNTLASWLIRITTGGYFSHAALVFLLPRREEGLDSTYVLESVTTGVGVGNFERWVNGRGAIEQVAILRLEGTGIDVDFFNKVAGLMLEYVNASYDYGRVVNKAVSIIFGIQSQIAKLNRGRASIRPWIPKSFICSGYIQYGLVEAMRRRKNDPSTVILKTGLGVNDRDGILAVLPEDIATSSKPIWLYVVRRGWVHQVSSYEEAKKTISDVQS